MPLPFPGPSRPSRSVARRSLLGGLAVLVVGGAADAIRILTRGGSSTSTSTKLPTGVVDLLTGSLHPSEQPTTAHPTTPASPTHKPTPGHSATHHHAATHGKHHTANHNHHKTDHHQTRKERREHQHVTLPPAQLHVRSRPAYRVDQLIPDPPKRAIALTIDDGPDPEYTPDVLRLLDKYQTQASFCVVGVHADAYPRLVRDIARAGHIVVNHSYTHALPFNRLPEKRIVNEITKTQRAIERAAGVTPQLFRAPGGEWTRFIFRACAAYGLEPLDWDVDPRDWARPGTKRITRRMLKARPGEIVLCHDGGGNRSETVRALRKVLPTWQRKGLETIALQVAPHYLPVHRAATSTPTQSPTP